MKMNSDIVLRRALQGILTAGSTASLIGWGASALAQTAPAAATSAASTRLSQIIVTGSHIPQTAIAHAQPVIRISRQQIEATGFNTLGQILQNLSAAGASLNTQVNNGNNASETVNLHDLGDNRVLVLVNGQRWGSTLSGAVDLTTIPLSIVSRIEVLMDGASAIYGSEAIAGVINIITVKNFNGARASAFLGQYDARGDGGAWDGRRQQYSFTVGSSSDRSSVLLSAGYLNQVPVWGGQRNISKEPLPGYGPQNGSSFSLGGRFIVDNANGNSIGSFCQQGAVCDLSGPDPNDPSGIHPWLPNDHYNFSPPNTILLPQERWHIYSQGHYDLTDNLSFHFTTAYNQRSSQTVLAPFTLGMGLFSATEANGLRVGVAKDAPGNPFGVDLVPYSSTDPGFQVWCQRYGSSSCTSNFDILDFLGRRTVELGNRVRGENLNTFYFNGGFNGYFTAFGNQWSWNSDYVYSQTLETDIFTGLPNIAKVQQALSENCSTDPSCTPLNLFGGTLANGGQGSITPAARHFVSFTSHNVVKQVLRDYNATVGGSFWNGWYAGAWGVAAGYEYEELDGFSSPDALRSTNNTLGSKPTSGRENTNAEFAEINIPFANNAFLAKSLGVDLAERYSQFHWSGTGNIFQPKSTTVTTGKASKYAHSATPRVTFKWEPVQGLLFRGTWSQGFRIPSIQELFGGEGTGIPQISDPCALDPATTPRSDLPPGCNGNFHLQPNAQINTRIGGNAHLSPEKSTTRSAGFVFSPTSVPGLDFAADYFKTEVTNVVQPAGGQFYVNDCYFNQDASSCDHIKLVGSGDNSLIQDVVNLTENGGSVKVEGWDINVDYRLPLTPVGAFNFHLQANFLRSDVVCEANGICQDISGTAGPTQTGTAGVLSAQPKHRYNLSMQWQRGPWSTIWNIYLIGPMWENCVNAPVNGESRSGLPGAPPDFSYCSKPIAFNSSHTRLTEGVNRLGTVVYNDIQANYTVDAWNTTFTIGVDNIFDKNPPVSNLAAFADNSPGIVPTYRIPGRFFYGRVTINF